MDTKQGVLDILNDLTGEDLSDQMDENTLQVEIFYPHKDENDESTKN